MSYGMVPCGVRTKAGATGVLGPGPGLPLLAHRFFDSLSGGVEGRNTEGWGGALREPS